MKHLEMEEIRRQEIVKQKSLKSDMIAKKLQLIDSERQKRKQKRGKSYGRPESMLERTDPDIAAKMMMDPKLQQLKEALEAKRSARLAKISKVPIRSSRSTPSLDENNHTKGKWEELDLARKEFEKRRAAVKAKDPFVKDASNELKLSSGLMI